MCGSPFEPGSLGWLGFGVGRSLQISSSLVPITVHLEPPSGALTATMAGSDSFLGATSWPASAVPGGHTQLETVQKLSSWKSTAVWPLKSWTLASPSVAMVTTSPEVELRLSNVLDRDGRLPLQPGAATRLNIVLRGSWCRPKRRSRAGPMDLATRSC